MSKRPAPRLFSLRELAELKLIWPSVASDAQVCAWFGRDKHTLARVARSKLGLPSSRVQARARAFDATRDLYRAPEAI